MINALDQTGLAYFWSKITGRLATKADLVNGKVPVSQLPASGGGGVTSWNDLEDKPFGETVYQATTYTMPDMATTTYNAATFRTDDYDFALKLYRVGNALPVGSLLGGDISYISPFGSDTVAIAEKHIFQTSDGVCTVVFADDIDFPSVCVCSENGKTVDIDAGDNIHFVATIAQAGTYLIWSDLSIFEEGATYYVSEINTVDFADIQQLDPKFYKQSVHIIAATATIQDMVSAFSTGTAVAINMESGTTTQALNAFADDTQVIVAFTSTNASTQTVVTQFQFILSQFDGTTNALSADVVVPFDLQYVGLSNSVPCDIGYKIVLSNDVLTFNWQPEKSSLVLRLSMSESLSDDVTIGGLTVADIKERSQLTAATVKYPLYSGCTEAQTQAILQTGAQLGTQGVPLTVELNAGGQPPLYLYARNVTLMNDIVCELMSRRITQGVFTWLLAPVRDSGNLIWVVVTGTAA